MDRWNLDALYTGCDSEAFKKDFDAVDLHIRTLNDLSEHLDQNDPVTTCRNIVTSLSDYVTLTGRLGNYLSLRNSANTSDTEIVSLFSRLNMKDSHSAVAITRFKKWIAQQDIDALCAADPLLKEHEFWLNEIIPKFLLNRRLTYFAACGEIPEAS